ncbi:MAG: clostripain-related cysteine peptidase, partial [Planctomycetota bacterium]|nr:clostripain-related cysteine peptidase [Planctomycetota bacterium]
MTVEVPAGMARASRSTRTSERRAAWTFMVYMGADNNLEWAGIEDFLEMASVGSTADVNIVVQFDRTPCFDTRYKNWSLANRFHIGAGMEPYPKCAVADWGDGRGAREVNMGDPRNLTDFVKWAAENFPAERYALVLWNHGGGWRVRSERTAAGSRSIGG